MFSLIRSGSAAFDPKLDTFTRLVRYLTINRGKPAAAKLDAFFAAGYDRAQLVDTIIVIGDKLISDFLHSTTQIPVNFPSVLALEEAHV